MSKINVAVIGTGNMGQHHARVYSEMPEVNLVAVCDQDEERGKTIAQKYGCKFYKNYETMLTQEKIQAASIVVPTFLHHKVACDVLDKGIHILLEKPIATTLEEAQEIINKAQRKKLLLMVGHIERFNPAIERLKKLINSGHLGTIISLNTKRVGGIPTQIKSASVIIDLAIHDIDISNYLLEEEPTKFFGFKSKNIIKEQEDSAIIVLKYRKTVSIIENNWITPVKIRTLDVTGTKAFARLDYIHQTIMFYKHFNTNNAKYGNFKEFVTKFSPLGKTIIRIKKAEPLKRELENFIHSVKTKTKPLVDGKIGYNVLKIALNL